MSGDLVRMLSPIKQSFELVTIDLDLEITASRMRAGHGNVNLTQNCDNQAKCVLPNHSDKNRIQDSAHVKWQQHLALTSQP